VLYSEGDMIEVIGYFVTWTAYGTWLPGDSRGWQKWHQGWQRPNLALQLYSSKIMTEDPVFLTSEQRTTVETTIRKHCELRQWHLWAVNCRTNHAHVVLTARDVLGTTTRDQLKAWCTRNLKTAFNPLKKNWWAEGGYVDDLETKNDLSAAIEYTLNAQ
jgi:REP element-mobilizing transposase RayT